MIKKFSLISAILALFISGVSAESKSGVFAGVNVGVPITTSDYSGYLKNIKNALPTSGVGYALGINVGYKQMFNENMGLRYYVDYNFNQSFGSKSGTISSDATINQHLVTANIDFLYNFTSSFGAYVGIGLGYQYYSMKQTLKNSAGLSDLSGTSTSDEGGFALPINVGVNYNLSANQTIDIGAKLNTFGVSVKSDSSGQSGKADLRTFIIKVGYTYTF